MGGALSIRLHGHARRTRPGDAILFSPGAAQDYGTADSPGFWHLRWAHFVARPNWMPWLMWPEADRGVGCLELRGPEAQAVDRALQRMLTASRLGGAQAADLAMNALEEALIQAASSGSDERLRRADPRVQRAAHFLAAHPSEPYDPAVLAAACGLSISRLAHLFQASLGTTPRRFGEDIRLGYARQLIEQTDLPIRRIAAEVGYGDPLYFSRRYMRRFGSRPSASRG
ncbi:MAG: helix-turn-helix domain-containing protein [Opitutaceae bacterium]